MSEHPSLEIRNLHVTVADKEILKGVDLVIRNGEKHALMGPNGSGKSTLSYALMGHPNYRITQGEVLFQGENLLPLGPDERARKGLFLAFQYPMVIPGVKVFQFLRNMLKARRAADVSVREFRQLLKTKMGMLDMKEEFVRRYLNEGFSGGEKKRHEILQMALLEPTLALLDETDSGLDIDALRIVCDGINAVAADNPQMGLLIITHYQRMLNYIEPDFVHILFDGRIVKSGSKQLALDLEAHGYELIENEFRQPAQV
ncbi:MAG: Fe-S cluster assembly ATPase SufC [Candidatus Melainabacteria bacterium HGW-Melainabacteria-1]|nr:MAG: Fe-S cluster assembly ATPase SufC [Candidatus Melainabacteria bacterium HGW-Melainabacteria-1]